MRLLVCGGRSYEDWNVISKTLKEINPTILIQGGAAGADRLAHKWADHNGVPVVTYPANWSAGKKGGPMRNDLCCSTAGRTWWRPSPAVAELRIWSSAPRPQTSTL